jgi:CubicO group peptidase (beta-lactamase class C family)
MADLQAEVQAAADEMVAAGTETGLQVAVHRHGLVVADVVSGVEDAWTATPVTPGTLFYAASAAKGVAASLAHVLAERGDITYDLRLADVWPEFAACGKEPATLRHVLLHTAGLPGLPSETTVADLCDWDRMCAALAAAEPWWRPGSRADVLTADIPSLGTMTARGAARMYAALLGHADGIELVSDRRRTAMAAVAFTGTDEVMGFPASWAFGYSPDRPGGVPSRRGSTFGMVGANGAAAYADIDSGLAVAVMRNGPTAAGLAAVTRIDRLIAGTEEHQ